MNIKQDHRHYYIKGLLRQFKASPFNLEEDRRIISLSHRYRLPGWPEDEMITAERNYVIDMAIEYITELEAEIEKLQYVARIIEMAKENSNG